MKRLLCIIMTFALLCSCAAADWTCADPNCGAVWDDSLEICNECGAEAPLHGLTVMVVGDDFLRVQWYGCMADDVVLFQRAEGVSGWTVCGNTDKRWALINGLNPGTTYEIMLMDWNGSTLTISAATTVQGTPAEDLLAQYNAAAARVAELEASVDELQSTVDAQAAIIEEQAAANVRLQRAAVRTGDYITYGRYPQTGAGDDETPIEWLVLDVQDGKALVISRYGLDVHMFARDTYLGWINSDIRSYLNQNFLYAAFNYTEQSAIVTTRITTPDYNGNNGGVFCMDKIWLLSREEVNQYFPDEDTRKTVPTAYAVGQSAYQSNSSMLEGQGCSVWWLRSPGLNSDFASLVRADGSLFYAYVYFTNHVVRPALWLDLDAAAEIE